MMWLGPLVNTRLARGILGKDVFAQIAKIDSGHGVAQTHDAADRRFMRRSHLRKRLVRAAGIEPALCRQNWILSPARLPVPPRPHEAASSSHSSSGATLLRLSIAPICHDSERQVQPHPARNAGVEIVYSAASFTGAGPARNCSSRSCSSALAAFKCFAFTWP
jgi:hypothetical protein